MASSPASFQQNSLDLAAIILAGGQSKRMGRDKALIETNGMPMLQQICEVAQDCCPRVYVVTPWPERYRALLPTDCQMIQEARPPDAHQSPGPLVGFAQGLAQIQAQWVLLLACDLPLLRSEALRQWQSQLLTVKQETIALLPKHAKGWEPLCGFYRASCLPSLQAFIEGGGRSFQKWLAGEPVEVLTVVDPQMLANCNTPAYLARLNDLPAS